MVKFLLFTLIFNFISLIHTQAHSQEPPLKDLEKIALQRAGLTNEEVKNWKKQARLSALLPKLNIGLNQRNQLSFQKTLQDSISITSSQVTLGPPQNELKEDKNRNYYFEVTASWDLQNLLFNRDILAASTEARYRWNAQRQLIFDLHQAYFERRQLIEQTRQNARSPSLQLKLESLEAQLDQLTGGYFSNQIQKGNNDDNF